MSNRAQACAWIAAVCVLAPHMARAQERTERDIVELIVRDGPQARAIRADVEVTRREQFARLAIPNPSVTYTREGVGFTEFLQVEQSLPIFGTRAAVSRAGAAAIAAAEAHRDARLWLLRSDAVTAVSRVLAEQARLAVARAHMRDLERLIEVLHTREREGEGSRFDRLRAQEEFRDATQLLTGATVALTAAKAVLAGLLPADVTVPVIAAATNPAQAAPAVDTLVTRARSAGAELRALQQTSDRAGFEATAARRARLPAPTIAGGVKRADGATGRASGGVFGLSLALPLFDNGAREAARWEAERNRANAEREAIERRLAAAIAGAAEVLSARQTALAMEAEGSAEELTRIAEVAYREGEAGILELLDAVRTAARARNRLIDLRLDARLAQIALERAVGETLWP